MGPWGVQKFISGVQVSLSILQRKERVGLDYSGMWSHTFLWGKKVPLPLPMLIGPTLHETDYLALLYIKLKARLESLCNDDLNRDYLDL